MRSRALLRSLTLIEDFPGVSDNPLPTFPHPPEHDPTGKPPHFMKYDVIVLGAGMVGVSAALALQARGRTVALIDRRPPPRKPRTATQA